MAYDLADYYNDTLASSSNSSAILESLSSNNKYSTLSKITYSTGNSKPILGYTTTGSAIYDETIGASYSEELKQAIKTMHTRNNDTMLRGIGYNTIENTSTGLVAVFKSQGDIVATVTEKGQFTGSITLSQISDLSDLTIDTSSFYNKGEIQNLLNARVSKYDLFNDDSKIKSDLLDSDIVRESELVEHASNTVLHLTASERTNWNAKYDKPASGIPDTDLSAPVRTILANAVDIDRFTNHANDGNIHITSDERSKWNKKYLKPVAGIPMSDLSETVQSILNHSVMDTTYNAHAANDIKHTTETEKAKWNAKYDKPAVGIPLTDLEQYTQDIIRKAVLTSTFEGHADDAIIHIDAEERIKWNAKYDKPLAGIPKSDLNNDLISTIEAAAKSVDLSKHISDSTTHISAEERTRWNDHADNATSHITSSERSKWNAKYDKPASGIPEVDLSVETREKLARIVYQTDFNQHLTDSVSHVTSSERTKWNAKYDKPIDGIPETHLAASFIGKVNAKADENLLIEHRNNNIAHISDSERTKWNAKYDKPVDGITEGDLEDSFVAKVNNAATSEELSEHVNDSVTHLTDLERNAWNAKYDKPVNGVPYSDLADDIKVMITNKAEKQSTEAHIANTGIHVTEGEKNAWNNKYLKPVMGIPESDISLDVTKRILSLEDVQKVTKLVNATEFELVVDTTIENIPEVAMFSMRDNVEMDSGLIGGGDVSGEPGLEDPSAGDPGVSNPEEPSEGDELPEEFTDYVISLTSEEHGIEHDSFKDYSIQVFKIDEETDTVTNVTNTVKFEYAVNRTTKDITITFKEAFKGVLYIK